MKARSTLGTRGFSRVWRGSSFRRPQADTCSAEGRRHETETGNCAWKASGTQGRRGEVVNAYEVESIHSLSDVTNFLNITFCSSWLIGMNERQQQSLLRTRGLRIENYRPLIGKELLITSTLLMPRGNCEELFTRFLPWKEWWKTQSLWRMAFKT